MKTVNDKLTDDDILAECRYQSAQASGSEFASDELTESRKNALRYYLGRSRGDEVPGRSTFISKDVADMIDSMLTQLMPVFTADDLVQFEAVSQQDEAQAKVESQFCNRCVMEKNNGYILFETLLKDALLSKNATAKVSVDITEDVKKESYKGLNPMEVFQVMQPQQQNQTIDVTKFDEETGDLNIKRITTTKKLNVEAIAPENFNITSEHKSQYLNDVTYCSERYWVTKSHLIEQGHDAALVMDLPTSTADTKIDSIERNQINDEQNFFNTSPSMQIVEVEEHYIRIDQDGDGIAELHKVLTVENKLLSNELAPVVPYANGVAFLMGHRFFGLSVYDKIRDVQDMKTHFMRQWADNALVHNHKKYVVNEDNVNMDDLLNGRPNGIIRATSTDAVMELPTSDVGPSCQMALDYYDKVRTDRTGSTLDLQSNQVAMPSNVGDAGVSTIIANLEKVTGLVSRNFSETLVTSLYLLVHKYYKLYFQEEMSAKMGGEWAQTNPGQWLEREQVNVKVPPTPTEKIQQKVALGEAIEQAQQEMQMGKTGITTDDNQIYQMKCDYFRMAGIDNPERYFIDPNSQEAQQVAQQNAQQQQQAQEKAENDQQIMLQAQIQSQIELTKAQTQEVIRNWENDKEQLEFDYQELQTKAQMDKYKADLAAEMDEAKIVGDATTKLSLAEAREEHERDLKMVDMELGVAGMEHEDDMKKCDMKMGMMKNDKKSDDDSRCDGDKS